MLKTIRFKMVVLRGMGFLLFISCCIFATAEEEVDVADGKFNVPILDYQEGLLTSNILNDVYKLRRRRPVATTVLTCVWYIHSHRAHLGKISRWTQLTQP